MASSRGPAHGPAHSYTAPTLPLHSTPPHPTPPTPTPPTQPTPSKESASESSGGPALIITVSLAVGAAAFLFSRYKICSPNQLLVRTGLGIQDMKISKKGFLLPFQKHAFVDLTPRNLKFHLEAMSQERVNFLLPVSFTVGPKCPSNFKDGDPEVEHIKNYARRVMSQSQEDFERTIEGIVQGEMRVRCANLSIQQLFESKAKFKDDIEGTISEDLQKLGVSILNANLSELNDTPNEKYFYYLRQKAIESANNEARVQVAQAKQAGDVGVKQREATTMMETSRLEREATIFKNEQTRQTSESNTTLKIATTEMDKRSEMVKIEAYSTIQAKKIEVDEQLAVKQALNNLETERAKIVSPQKAKKEATIIEGEGILARNKLEADAERYRVEQEALAAKNAIVEQAHAMLIQKQKEAEGVLAVGKAEAENLQLFMKACNNDPATLRYYLAVKHNLFPSMFEATAKAVQGLNPDIRIWNTNGVGEGSAPGGNPLDSITNMVKNIAPLIDAFGQHSGLSVGSLGKIEKTNESPVEEPAESESQENNNNNNNNDNNQPTTQ